MPKKKLSRQELITGAAAVGVGMTPLTAGARGMEVTISIPDEDGLALSGIVPITVDVHPKSNLKYVRTIVDGIIVKESTTVPSVHQWDTKQTIDGTHIIEAIAQYKTRKSTAKIVVSVNNTVVPPPPPPPFTYPQPPVGPFVETAGDHFYRDDDGLLTQKMYVPNAPGYGIGNMTWPYDGDSTGIWEVKDCKIEKVSRPVPRSSNGTAECGLWSGEKTLAERIDVSQCAWMEMVTLAACKGSRYFHLDLHDSFHVPCYVEHPSSDLEFKWCSIGGPKNLGLINDASSINAEWWYYDTVYGHLFPYQGRAGSSNVRFIECRIYCPPIPTGHPKPYEVNGGFLDAGTFGYEFYKCTFWGPGNVLGFPNILMDPSKPNKMIDCVFENAGSKEPIYHDNAIGIVGTALMREEKRKLDWAEVIENIGY